MCSAREKSGANNLHSGKRLELWLCGMRKCVLHVAREKRGKKKKKKNTGGARERRVHLTSTGGKLTASRTRGKKGKGHKGKGASAEKDEGLFKERRDG